MQLKMGVGMMEGGESGRLTGFSIRGGSEFAHVTPDGRLLIWDATLPKGGSPLEYVPSAHLASAPTCIAWNISPLKSPQKKNRRSVGGNEGEILALGTSSGSILLYSPKKNDVVSTLQTKNEERILSLAWKSGEPLLFAGGAHGNLFSFNTSKSLLSSKVSFGNQAITGLAIPHKEHPNRLLLASNVISLVCLDSGTVLQTLTAHSGTVNDLSILNEDLFLSASSNDKVLNVWSLSTLGKPAFTLSLKESALSVDSVLDEENVLRISVVTGSGALKIFGKELDSSPSKAKPLKPISVVQIAAEKDESGKVKPLPVLSSRFSDMNEIRIAYGEKTKPQFEVLKIDELEKETCLTRSLGLEEGSKENNTGYSSNLQVPSLKSGVTVPSSGVGKRKAASPQDSTSESLTMIDRLKLLSKDYDPKTSPPRSDSLLQLLLQGLHNKDEKILNSVLDRTELTIIDNTAKRLPVEAIVPLIEELQRYLRGRGIMSLSHANWLKSILLHHSTFIMSLPKSDNVLISLISMMEERTRNYPALIQLQGKLNLITKQMSEHAEPNTNADSIGREALLVYQNDSDDELPNAMDELLLPASDTDDNWDDDEDEENEKCAEDSSDETDEDEVELLNGENEVEMEEDSD